MLRGITISVNYGPLLDITLQRNMRHFSECLVVTSPEDRETQRIACSVPGVRVLETDAFTRHGARFNKGLAFEEGFDALGRSGWLCIWDADCIFPDEIPLDKLRPGWLHGASRRILEDPSRWTPDLDWRTCQTARDGGPIGFCQIFQGDDPVIRDKRPWYDVSFAHGGGGDAYFMGLWPNSRRCILPFSVLHLGPRDTNWFGTSPEARDIMAAFVVRNGWARSHPRVDHSAVDRVGEIVERVEVPGYEPSGFELPFVKRAKQLKR